MGSSSESKMATSRGLMPRRSSRFVAHVFLTLITLCLFCDILRLASFTSAVPVTQLKHRRDVSGPNNPSISHGAVASRDGPNRRNVGDDISNTFHDVVDKFKDVFKPSDDKKMTAVEVVAEYAYNELDHGVELKKLQENFKKLHDDMEHGDNKTDDGDWIHKQIKDTIPGLKETFEKANETEGKEKKHSVSSPTSSSRGLSLDLLNNEPLADSSDRGTIEKRDHFPCPPISEVFNDTLIQVFNTWKGTPRASRKICPTDKWNYCDYSALRVKPGDGMPDEERRSLIEGCIAILTLHPECMSRAKNQDGIDACLNDLDTDGKIKRYHIRDEVEKPRPKPGDADYYTDPSFFPYPMPPTPAIPDELKNSLGDAFNTWRTSIANGSKPSCQWGSSKCNKADAITTKTDYTSKDQRKEIVEACIESLIEHPNCLEGYYTDNVLKPYLSELVDKGKIQDEDGKIKKLWTRMIYIPPVPIAADSMNLLALTYNNEAKISCTSTPNKCDDVRPIRRDPERRPKIEACIQFLGLNPSCLQDLNYDWIIRPYISELTMQGKIKEKPIHVVLSRPDSGKNKGYGIHSMSKRYPEPEPASPTTLVVVKQPQAASSNDREPNVVARDLNRRGRSRSGGSKGKSGGGQALSGVPAAQKNAQPAANPVAAPNPNPPAPQPPLAPKPNPPAPQPSPPASNPKTPLAQSSAEKLEPTPLVQTSRSASTIASATSSIPIAKATSASLQPSSTSLQPISASPKTSSADSDPAQSTRASSSPPAIATTGRGTTTSSSAMASETPSNQLAGESSNPGQDVSGGNYNGQSQAAHEGGALLGDSSGHTDTSPLAGHDVNGANQMSQGQAGQGSGSMNGESFGPPNPPGLAGKAFNGAKQILQGQTGQGDGMVYGGSHGYTDPSSLAGQGVNGLNQDPQGQVGHGSDWTGSGSTGYTDPGSQAGQGNDLTSTDPTIQQGQGNSMADTGSTGGTYSESQSEAAPS